MPTEDPQNVEDIKPNRATRRSQEKVARATMKALVGKKRAEREVTVTLDGKPATMLFRAIGSKEWDLLQSQHKPTKAQIEQGMQFNVDTFPAALLSRVCVDPAMDEEVWQEIFDSEDWSRGELGDLYNEAISLNNAGFSVPFNASA